MKRFCCVLLCLVVSVPAWPAAKRISIAELKDMLKSLQQQKKTDLDVAIALKQIELSEELTRGTMNSLVEFMPGQQATEQIYVLEARSATLVPPKDDIPTTAALDAGGQKALLDKMNDYVGKTYAALPGYTATKTTVRFQDNVEAASSSSGMAGSAKEITVESGFVVNPMQYIRYIGSTESKTESSAGAEKAPTKDKSVRWGANGQIVLLGQGPVLTTVLREAEDSGALTFSRWEIINGKAAAVFSFGVQKKKSHYAVDYCCFPDVSQAGIAGFTSAATTGRGGASGNFQTATDWHDYKASGLPYHGEVFVDPDSGIVVRMVTFVEFKNSDVVHQEDERVDFGPVTIGGKALVIPVRTMINTEVVPNGDSGSAGRYMTRRTLLTTEYKDYQLEGK